VPLTAVRMKRGPRRTLVNNKVVAQPVTLGLRNEDEGYAEVRKAWCKARTSSSPSSMA
jgi:hypothetical protein